MHADARMTLSPIRMFRPKPEPRRARPQPQPRPRPKPQPAPTPTVSTLRIRSGDSGWQLLVDDLGQPAWTVSTKRKAVRAARDAAQELGCTLVIETARGKVQRTLDFTSNQEIPS